MAGGTGVSVGLAVDRLEDGTAKVWLGVRPEKLRMVGTPGGNGTGDHAGHRDPGHIGPGPSDSRHSEPGQNRLTGIVVDASFTGLATSYLVRLPWGQELMVGQQNDGARGAARGEQVTLGWAAEHGFALSADQDAHAGAQDEADDLGAG